MVYLVLKGVWTMVNAIVFTQNELNKAIDHGASHIILCDNHFNLPSIPDIAYTAIGIVTASADFCSLDDFNITCVNFSPKLKKRPKTVHISNKAVGTASITDLCSSHSGSFSSSYRFGSYTSFITSYLTSFVTSYRYRYEYRQSFSGSYSYRLSQSYSASFSTSFKPASFLHKFKVYDRILKEISVNGYGIHLI